MLVTGQTVVETGTVEVTTTVDEAGQSVTVGPHLVMVLVVVVKMVEVVHWVVVLDGGGGWVVGTSVLVTGQTVVDTGMVEVTVTVDEAGQSVTVGAHLVMV